MSNNNIDQYIRIHITNAVDDLAQAILGENMYDEEKSNAEVKAMDTKRLLDKLSYYLRTKFTRSSWMDMEQALRERFVYASTIEESEENVRQLKLMIMNTITIISLF